MSSTFGCGYFRSPERKALAFGLVGVVGILLLVTFQIERINLDAVIGLLTLGVLLLVSIPVLSGLARSDKDPTLFTLLMWGVVFKVAFTLVRYYVITVVYGDNGDAGVYNGMGSILMDLYRQGIFVVEVPGVPNRGAETQRIAVVVGLIYMITGPSRYASSFIFSAMCFSGQVLMFRAFRLAVPEGDSRRYAVLVLFLPSMLFWPSSVGKEALMVCCIGILSFGAAQMLGTPARPIGMLTFAVGAAGLFFIRPHMALIAIVALGFASAVGNVSRFGADSERKAKSRAFALRMIALVLLIGGGSIATSQLSKVIGTADGDGGITSALEQARKQTEQGGSQFDPPAVSSPLGIPAAVVTVLFRPFPWEVSGFNSLVAASEGVLLAGLAVLGRRRILSWFKAVGKRPYLVFSAAFAMTFIIAFSYIGNFGILARQRTQMMPLALTVLGMPVAARKRMPGADTTSAVFEAGAGAARDAEPHSGPGPKVDPPAGSPPPYIAPPVDSSVVRVGLPPRSEIL